MLDILFKATALAETDFRGLFPLSFPLTDSHDGLQRYKTLVKVCQNDDVKQFKSLKIKKKNVEGISLR